MSLIDIAQLKAENDRLKAENAQLNDENEFLWKTVKKLTALLGDMVKEANQWEEGLKCGK